MSRPFGHPNNIAVLSNIVKRLFSVIFFIAVFFLVTISCNGLPRYSILLTLDGPPPRSFRIHLLAFSHVQKRFAALRTLEQK